MTNQALKMLHVLLSYALGRLQLCGGLQDCVPQLIITPER